ncbi:hypothetical protein [Streptomyces sp. NPDC056160]|uniref:hypothetical protein n=1 Tax=Streptomyces sp. NPDC056160 TaxID=3345731 RepID=UPI0035DA641D
MTAPIPRPPGVWRAWARDDHLNPEEVAARDAVMAAYARPKPSQPPEPPVDARPDLRLGHYQSLINRAGWKVRSMAGENRARIEGFHRDGAAVMVTAVRGRKVNAYVLPAARKRTPRWRAIHAADLDAFLLRRQVNAPYIPTSKCACGKRPYPTEAYAKAAIVDVTIRRVVKLRGLQHERRAYRCPDDDRVWHLTSIPKWYGQKKPKHQKEPNR